MYKKSAIRLFAGVAAAVFAAATFLLLFMLHEQKQINETLSDAQHTLQMQNQELQQEINDLLTKKGGIEEHGQLSIKGTQLVDQNGNPLMLRGVSSHGIAWYPEYTNYSALKTLKDYGANVFRIAMYVEQNDGYLEEPELNKNLLFSAIENSLAADLYTIVDWHVLRDENPNRNIEETVVLLSHKKPDGHINVKVEFGEGEGKVPLDNIAKRAEEYKPKERVTYKMIKEYIEAKYGFKVHTAYIAEVKRDLGLPMYDAPNAVEELKQPRKHPTAEKVEAIKDALKHFEVI